MPTNQEYFDRWEAAAPTPVDSGLTLEEIQKLQGTRLSDQPRWELYDKEMDHDPTVTPELQKEIDEYSQKHHDSSTNQTKEELQRFEEMNAEAAKQYQFCTPDEYNNVEERTGRVMHSSEFIKKLRSVGVRCWYRTHGQQGKVTLMIQRKSLAPEVGCWVQLGNMPELSIMRFDEHGIPLDEAYRGWRTCLLQLILKSALTEKQAEEVFGKPKHTAAFHRYNFLLQNFRNAGSSLNRRGNE